MIHIVTVDHFSGGIRAFTASSPEECLAVIQNDFANFLFKALPMLTEATNGCYEQDGSNLTWEIVTEILMECMDVNEEYTSIPQMYTYIVLDTSTNEWVVPWSISDHLFPSCMVRAIQLDMESYTW